jgi:hypothetical protein
MTDSDNQWQAPPATQRQVMLGDIVAQVAQPIARALDAVLGTKVQSCKACEKRRKALNKIGNFDIS